MVPFSTSACAVLAAARREAVALGHEYVGTELLLLALFDPDVGLTPEVLRFLEIDAAAVHRTVTSSIHRGTEKVPQTEDVPYTSRVRRALEDALAQADYREQAGATSEHLLLGLIRSAPWFGPKRTLSGSGPEVLARAGVNVPRTNTRLRRRIGPGHAAAQARMFIRELVGSESLARPLSDVELTRRLWHRAIEVTPSTVARYRTQLGIPSALKRRAR